MLAGGAAKALKAAVLAAACGALAAGVYGITQVDRGLADKGLAAISTVPAFINNAVWAGQAAVASVQALDAQLVATRASMQGMASSDPAAAATLAPYISVGAGCIRGVRLYRLHPGYLGIRDQWFKHCLLEVAVKSAQRVRAA